MYRFLPDNGVVVLYPNTPHDSPIHGLSHAHAIVRFGVEGGYSGPLASAPTPLTPVPGPGVDISAIAEHTPFKLQSRSDVHALPVDQADTANVAVRSSA